MGRPAHEIWELFTVVVARSREDNKAHPDVKCVFYNTLLTNAQPSRNMLRHALQCDELSDDAKVKWKDLARKQRHSIKPELPRHVRLRPSKSPPARYRLLTAFMTAKKHMLLKLDRGNSPIDCHDGWSNINNESIINFVITKPHIRPVFWKSISTHDAAHTSVFIACSISNAIDEIESVVGKGAVTSVVTDNTANMKGAWKILQHERQGIVCNGCAAHGMNLLMKDVLELEDFATIL
ncbi:hypothetical protein FI667_g5967, partial [Globisporangium splendens]